MADSPLVKAFIIGVFVMILISLGTAFFSLFRGKDPDSTATVKALTVRVALSVGLIGTLVVLNALGVISPNG
ncbi:MAG: DUF2909 domain-containing protein [Gammaproteobacteria bacterium]